MLKKLRLELIYWYCMTFYTFTGHRYVTLFGSCYIVIGEITSDDVIVKKIGNV
jgi:hypothetical protein